jgi:hypothetical protein
MTGLFGTRADLLIVLVYALQLAAPFVVTWSFRRARHRAYARHRQLQVGLLAVCAAAVLALEAHIRLAGGSGALVAGSALAGTPWFRVVFAIHVTGAVLTYAVWAGLAVVSHRRFQRELPGAFSARHRALGKAVFGGLCFTAASATAMFVVGFVV